MYGSNIELDCKRTLLLRETRITNLISVSIILKRTSLPVYLSSSVLLVAYMNAKVFGLKRQAEYPILKVLVVSFQGRCRRDAVIRYIIKCKVRSGGQR